MSLKAIRKTMSGLEKKGYETIITLFPWSNYPSLYIPACIPCNKVFGVFHNRKDKLLYKLVKRICLKHYTNEIIVPINTTQIQRNKLIMNNIGINNFEAQIIHIPSKNIKKTIRKKYVVLSVDSMDTSRRWPADKFIELANQLLDRYTYNIYITGSNLEEKILEKYQRAFGDNLRVSITVGKLSIDEWIEMVRSSQFVIGLDSGVTHIAASVGVTCFCLTGVWDGHRIMPYMIDKKMVDTTEPICIYRRDLEVDELACYGCYARRQYGWGNVECYDLCRSGHPCLCLQSIQVEDVIEQIEKAIRSKEANKQD